MAPPGKRRWINRWSYALLVLDGFHLRVRLAGRVVVVAELGVTQIDSRRRKSHNAQRRIILSVQGDLVSDQGKENQEPSKDAVSREAIDKERAMKKERELKEKLAKLLKEDPNVYPLF